MGLQHEMGYLYLYMYIYLMTFPSYFLGYMPCQNRQNVQMGSENEARKNGCLTRENDEESMDINGYQWI